MSFLLCIVARSSVTLIQEACWAIVLSDFGTGGARGAGVLGAIFERCGNDDRDPSGAMRPAGVCLGRKSFSLAFILPAAQLFTPCCAGGLPGLPPHPWKDVC